MIRNLALAVASVLVFLAGAEIFCRIVKPDERWFEDEYLKRTGRFREVQYHPVIGWSGRPYVQIKPFAERLNSRGLRGPEFPDAKPPGAVRIVALGDSCTFNIQFNDSGGPIPRVEIHDPYPADLNYLLAPLATPDRFYEVINGGVIGYTTLQGLRFMRHDVFRWSPDVILIKFGWNDHWIGHEPTEPRNSVVRRLYWVLLQSRFYALLRRSLLTASDKLTGGEKERHDVPREPPDVAALRVPPTDFEFNLRLLIREARAHGATPIVMNAPMSTIKPTHLKSSSLPRFLAITGYPNPREIFMIHTHYNAITEQVAREERAPFLDLDREFALRGRGNFFGTTELNHYNADGNWLIAELVLKELQRLGIAPRQRAAAASLRGITRSATSRAISR